MLLTNAAIASASYAGQALLVAGFAALLSYYYRNYKRPYLRYWSYAAGYFGLSCFLSFTKTVGLAWLEFSNTALTSLSITSMTLLYLAVGLLAIGVFDITRHTTPRRMLRRSVYFTALILGILTALPLLQSNPSTALTDPANHTYMTYLASGVALIAFGYMVLRFASASIGPRLIGVAFVLQGLKSLSLFYMTISAVAWRYSSMFWTLEGLFNVLFLGMVALGITIWLLESERHKAVNALQRAEYMNTHDALTGMENRDSLMSKIPVFVDTCRVNGRHLTTVMIGIDRFKAVNDSLGMRGGDRVLIEVAHRLKHLPQKPLTVSRVSGDSFVLIYDHLKRRTRILDLIDEVHRQLQQPMYIDGKQLSITCSFGVSRYPQQGNRAESLLSKANIAMANAKSPEYPSIMFYERGMDESYIRLADLEPELRNALLNNEFQLYLQPIYDVNKQQLTGFEALLRWEHPTRGLLPPDEFLPFAEQLGMAIEIDEWVMRNCAAMIARWRAQGEKVLPIAINLSAKQFQQPLLTEKLRSLFAEFELERHDIELEITENVAMSDIKTGLNVLKRLKEMGIRVAIDDFGTGYSSLAYLRTLPVDKIKIDRSFINELLATKADSVIVRKLIELSHVLDKQIVAEGVETMEQFKALSAMHCDCVQGFLLSPPVSEANSLTLLKKYWEKLQELNLHGGLNNKPAPSKA